MGKKQTEPEGNVSDDQFQYDTGKQEASKSEIVYNVDDSVPWHIAAMYIIQVERLYNKLTLDSTSRHSLYSNIISVQSSI